jgi:hypothetical protein
MFITNNILKGQICHKIYKMFVSRILCPKTHPKALIHVTSLILHIRQCAKSKNYMGLCYTMCSLVLIPCDFDMFPKQMKGPFEEIRYGDSECELFPPPDFRPILTIPPTSLLIKGGMISFV